MRLVGTNTAAGRDESEVLKLAAAVEGSTRHPLADAVLLAANQAHVQVLSVSKSSTVTSVFISIVAVVMTIIAAVVAFIIVSIIVIIVIMLDPIIITSLLQESSKPEGKHQQQSSRGEQSC